MPTQWAHSFYWSDQTPSTVVIPPVISRGGYPLWQSNIVHSLPLGPLGSWWDALYSKLAWWFGLVLAVYRLSRDRRITAKAYIERLSKGQPEPANIITKFVERVIEKPVEVVRETPSVWQARINTLPEPRRALLLRTLDQLESKDYDAARRAVRVTATTLHFNRPEVYVEYSRMVKGTPRRAENVARHVKACDLVQKEFNQTSTGVLPNPYVNFLVELAYQEYTIQPWGDR